MAADLNATERVIRLEGGGPEVWLPWWSLSCAVCVSCSPKRTGHETPKATENKRLSQPFRLRLKTFYGYAVAFRRRYVN